MELLPATFGVFNLSAIAQKNITYMVRVIYCVKALAKMYSKILPAHIFDNIIG